MQLGRLHDDSYIAIHGLGHLACLLHQGKKRGGEKEVGKVVDGPAGRGVKRVAFSRDLARLTGWRGHPW